MAAKEMKLNNINYSSKKYKYRLVGILLLQYCVYYVLNFKQSINAYKMKKKLTIISLIFISATAFTLIKPLNGVDDTRKRIVHSYMISDYNNSFYDPIFYPDTAVLFSNPDDGKKDPNNKLSLRSLHQSGFPSAYGMASAITYDYYYHQKEFDKIFVQKFGKSLFGKHVPMAKNDNGERPEFFFYSADGLQTAFNKLYVKPTNKFEEIAYQKMYNLTAKAYMRDFTKFLAYIMSQKPTFIAAGNRYLKNAKTSKDFNPYEEMETSFKKLFSTEASTKQFPNFSNEVSFYDLGTLLRRQCDGTLPTLLNCLKTVLKDYDPEALKLIKGTF